MKATISILMIFFSFWLAGCVFIYNTGQGATFPINDNDKPDIKADVKARP